MLTTRSRALAAVSLLCISATGQDLWTEEFAGWEPELHPITTGDVDGDGMADLVGFGGYTGVWVAFSHGGGFEGHELLLAGSFCLGFGWDTERHIRTLADVNGDGMADVVGFGEDGVWIALSEGRTFSAPELVLEQFGADAGWTLAEHPRFVADIDGDGDADIVGCGAAGLAISRNVGGSFGAAPSSWAEFGTNQGWTADHDRMMADVNGDGRADLVGFGPAGVVVSLGSAAGLLRPSTWSTAFFAATGKFAADQTETLADVNGDGRADLVVFGPGGTRIGLSTGAGFAAPVTVGAFANENGWSGETPRYARDLDGDGHAELVGFGPSGMFVARNSFGQFLVTETVSCRFGTSRCYDPGPCAQRWLADVDGDGRTDVLGEYDEGIWVDTARSGCRRVISAPCVATGSPVFYSTQSEQIEVRIDAGGESGGEPFLLLASRYPPRGSTLVNGVPVPLVRDAMFEHLEKHFPDSEFRDGSDLHRFMGTAGVLSPLGRAVATYQGTVFNNGYGPASWGISWAVVYRDGPTGEWRSSGWVRTSIVGR